MYGPAYLSDSDGAPLGFFTQLFVYVTMAHLPRCASIVHHLHHIPPFLELSVAHMPVGYKTWSPPQDYRRCGPEARTKP